MNFPTRSLAWLALLLTVLAGPHAYADCKGPQYRVGKTYPSTTSDVVLDISIRLEDFTLDKLICLAADLKEKYGAPEIAVSIFSSHRAAVSYRFHPVEALPNDELWASQKHAEYYYSAEKHREYVVLIPDGLSPDNRFDTRVDLPTSGKPSCKLNLENRCLLAFNHIGVTGEAGSGTVALAAQIEQTGVVSGVRIVNQENVASTDQRAFANFAVQNLKSWRFEPSKTRNRVKITYSLERVDTALKDGVDVQIMLPDKVKIKMGPLLLPSSPNHKPG